MLPKKCKFCDRRFLKAEHLKRHQRTHTGERPYKCTECAKCFSRSDVLSRHVRAHTQQDVANTNANATIEAEDGDISSTSERESGDEQQWASPVHQGQDEHTIEIIVAGATLPQNSELMHVLPNDHPEISTSCPEPTPMHHARLNGTEEHFTQHSNQESTWTGPEMDMAELLSYTPSSRPAENMSGISSVNEPNQRHREQPQSSAISHNSAVVRSDNTGGDPDPDETRNLSRLWLTPGDGGFAIPDEYQFWFNHLDHDLRTGPDSFMFDSGVITMPDVVAHAPPSQNHSLQLHTPPGSLSSVDSAVPNERFLKVKQCWPHKSAGRRRMMHTLWRDLCHNSLENLFSEPRSFSERISSKPSDHTRRGLDDEVRDRLEKIFSRPPTARDFRNGSVDSGGARSELLDQEQITMRSLSDSTKFPPADILDMGLDLYLKHFNPLYPFIHLPTFNPKTANSSLLHVMCLIGLTLINSRGATKFVHREFSTVFEVVEAELSSYSLYPEVQSSYVLSTMATGILVVALAEILGGKIDQSRTHRLSVQILTQCHEQRLFAVGDGEILNDTTFESFQDIDLRWKAWSRIESAKRCALLHPSNLGLNCQLNPEFPSLIITMLLVDTWSAGTQNTCPILRTDNLQFLLPCDADLFRCQSASKWIETLSKGQQMFMPVVGLSSHHATIPKMTRPMDTLGMQGVLSLIRLRCYEDYHRLLSGSDRDATERSLVPWRTFTTDPQAHITQALVVEVMETYYNILGQMNPNCIALWHNTCIMLTADLRIFELGAGCEGPDNARQALKDIARWTQTTAARRAVLHAAQTFKIMSNRRASDGDPFHLSNCLFHSALVLALYIFMVPQTKEDEVESSTFELLDDVDWRRIGREGLGFDTDYVDDPAVNFINGGGSISLNGVVHHGGYQAARRILVDFVQLLDEVGKWRAGRYTDVLRIMSDALVDDESLEFHL